MKRNSYTKLEWILLISTLIGTIILLLEYVGIKPDDKWPLHITKIFKFFFVKIPLIWGIVVVTIASLLSHLLSRKRSAIAIVRPNTKDNFSMDKTKKTFPVRLEKIREDILLHLSRNEGRGITWSNIQRFFSDINETTLIYHIDELKREHYVKYIDFRGFYTLGHPGRKYLTKNKLI